MKRLTLILALGFGIGLGCAGPSDVEYFRGAGAFFCCDAAGSCFYTSDGECEPGELLSWCPTTEQLATGQIICADWG